MQLKIQNLLDESQCYDQLRELRWPEGRECPFCDSHRVIRRGFDDQHPARQRYECKDCTQRFDDLTGTVFAGHHQPLKIWMLALYFMGLNLSNSQIAKELDLDPDVVQDMTRQLREGLVKKTPVVLEGDVEFDEVYIVAGHKGQPSEVAKADRLPRRRRLKGAPGRGTAETDKPPVLGMIARGGFLVLELLPNVQQKTIKPHILEHVAPGSHVYTDEYVIYSRLKQWGYEHETVNHGQGEYARDDDGDGFCEVHVNTIEGAWSLLRSWLKSPPRDLPEVPGPLPRLFRVPSQRQKARKGRFTRPY